MRSSRENGLQRTEPRKSVERSGEKILQNIYKAVSAKACLHVVWHGQCCAC